METMDNRHGIHSTMITSQLPTGQWHAAVGDSALADTILNPLSSSPDATTSSYGVSGGTPHRPHQGVVLGCGHMPHGDCSNAKAIG